MCMHVLYVRRERKYKLEIANTQPIPKETNKKKGQHNEGGKSSTILLFWEPLENNCSTANSRS